MSDNRSTKGFGMSVIREMFGPSKKEIWSELSRELGGEFDEGGFFKNGKITLEHGEWTITLDTYVVSTGKSTIVYTRMRAPYVNKDGFRFNIYRKNVFTWIGKIFRMQDVEIGDPQFDDDYVIQGAPEEMVKRLFSNQEIRRLIENQKSIHFMVKDDEGWFKQKFPEGVDELYFQIVGVIKDKERLKDLFELFSTVLDELCHIGSAYKTNPNVELKS
jgi:hypothetical protein